MPLGAAWVASAGQLLIRKEHWPGVGQSMAPRPGCVPDSQAQAPQRPALPLPLPAVLCSSSLALAPAQTAPW